MALKGRAVHEAPCIQSEQKTDDHTHPSSGDGCNRNNQKVAAGIDELVPSPNSFPKTPGEKDPPDIPGVEKQGAVKHQVERRDITHPVDTAKEQEHEASLTPPDISLIRDFRIPSHFHLSSYSVSNLSYFAMLLSMHWNI